MTLRRSVFARLALATTSLAVASLGVAVAPASAATSPALADAYVDYSVPSTNYGTRTTVKADNSPVVVAYLKFAVTGSPASAALQLTATSSQSTGIRVRAVADTTWSETAITAATAPALGAEVASTGPITAGTTYTLNVTPALASVQNGMLTLAVVTTATTSVSFGSRESATPPQLIAPMPPAETEYAIAGSGSSWTATPAGGGAPFTGSLKSVVETAVAALNSTGGGVVRFGAQTYDLGTDYFKLTQLHNIQFIGAGMTSTTIVNNTSVAADTEPFNFSGAFDVVIRDMTVNAYGTPRSTSDTIDFDQGNRSTVQNVRIQASRARGIIFDGKNAGWTSTGNHVIDCLITGVPGNGVEFLASTGNEVRGTTVRDTGRHGIQMAKSSTIADQPNKKSSDNLITGNTVDNAGMDGINVTSGDRNIIRGNTVTNSSDDTTSRDGIRLTTADGITAVGNVVDTDTATDTQTVKTQSYGLNISGSGVSGSVVGPGNVFTGNRVGPIKDTGTGTIYQ